MSAYSAAPGWNPSRRERMEVRLTRRGRLARAAALVGVAVLLSVSVVDSLGSRPVLAGDFTPMEPIATRSVVVDSGDSLWSIAAAAAPGTDPRETIHAIRQLNGLTTSMLQPGQVLLIPTRS